MSINMADVKQIINNANNKEIVKIQDSLGNILWQKQSPGPSITYPFMAMSNSANQYSKAVNDEWTWTSGALGPISNSQGQYYWSDGTNLYYSNDSDQYVYTGSIDNYDSTKWVAKSWSYSRLRGNDLIKIKGDIYSVFYSFRDDSRKYNSTTDTWEAISFSNAGSNMSGDTIWTDGTDIYWNTSSTTIKVLDQNTLTWGSDITVASTNASSYYYWTDGTDVYYSNGTTHKVWDKANRNWVNKTWTGMPNNNFSGNEVFFYNNEVYVRQGRSPYAIYKLDISTSTWTSTYTNPMGSSSNFRGARMWDLGGRATANTNNTLTGLRRPNK